MSANRENSERAQKELFQKDFLEGTVSKPRSEQCAEIIQRSKVVRKEKSEKVK